LRIKKNKEFEFELDPHSHFLNNAPHINHLVLERVVKMEKERVLLLPFFLSFFLVGVIIPDLTKSLSLITYLHYDDSEEWG